MTPSNEVDLPANSTILQIIKMLKSIQNNSQVSSPPGHNLKGAFTNETVLIDNTGASNMESDSPETEQALDSVLLSQVPRDSEKKENVIQKKPDTQGKMNRVTLNNYLKKKAKGTKPKVPAIKTGPEHLAKSFHPQIHYSNLNINMSNNNTSFYNNSNQTFGHGPHSLLMGNFQNPHFMHMPNFNLINSPRGMFPGTLRKVDFEGNPAAHFCSEHQSKAELICLTDRKIICTNCALFGVHKGHNYKKFGEFMEECRHKLASLELCDKNGKLKDFVDAKKEHIAKIQRRISEKKEEMFGQVESVLEALVSKLRAQEIQIKGQIAEQFGQFEASLKQLESQNSENRLRFEAFRNKLEKVKMAMSSRVPDFPFLLDHLFFEKYVQSKVQINSLLSSFNEQEKKVSECLGKQLGKYRVNLNPAFSLKNPDDCYVTILYEKEAAGSANSKSEPREVDAVQEQRQQVRRKVTMKKSLNFSPDKEFEDFQFNLELNKRLKEASKPNSRVMKCSSKNLNPDPTKSESMEPVKIYTDLSADNGTEEFVTSGDNPVAFDPIHLMEVEIKGDTSLNSLTEESSPSPEIDQDSFDHKMETSKPEVEDTRNLQDIRRTVTMGKRGVNKSIKFLQGMKNKTKNFELLIEQKPRPSLRKSNKHHKSHRHLNQHKLNDLANFSQNSRAKKRKFNSGYKESQNGSTPKQGNPLTGYLSDRNVYDNPLISNFDEFSHAINQEMIRKSSSHNLNDYWFSK